MSVQFPSALIPMRQCRGPDDWSTCSRLCYIRRIQNQGPAVLEKAANKLLCCLSVWLLKLLISQEQTQLECTGTLRTPDDFLSFHVVLDPVINAPCHRGALLHHHFTFIFNIIGVCVCVCVCVCEVAQSCPTLCNPMDFSAPGSSVWGILQARILEWVALSFSRGSSQLKDQTCVSCIGWWILLQTES